MKHKEFTKISIFLQIMSKNNDTKKHYVDNQELEKELVDWIETGEMSERLGNMFIKIAEGLSYNRKFINYTSNWKDEMVSKAVLHLCSYADNYNPDHPKSNAFAYCTQIAYRAFQQWINKAKRETEFKHDLFETVSKFNCHLLRINDRKNTD